MRKTPLVVSAGILAIFAALAFSPSEEPAHARYPSTFPTKLFLQEATAMESVSPVASGSEDDLEKMRAYLNERLVEWNTTKYASPTDTDLARYESTARALATVAMTEEPAWKDDTSKARTAILVLGLGWMETRDREYVERGWCNNLDRKGEDVVGDVVERKWRTTAEGYKLMNVGGGCDGGQAHSRYQIHPENGLAFIGNDVVSAYGRSVNEKDVIDGKKLIGDKEVANRVAWRIVRRSVKATGGLVQYTGEGSCPCPKSALRMRFGLSEYTKHPYDGVVGSAISTAVPTAPSLPEPEDFSDEE